MYTVLESKVRNEESLLTGDEQVSLLKSLSSQSVLSQLINGMPVCLRSHKKIKILSNCKSYKKRLRIFFVEK